MWGTCMQTHAWYCRTHSPRGACSRDKKFYADSLVYLFKRAEHYSLLSSPVTEMTAGHGLNSTSELKLRALLVLPRGIEGAEILLHVHEQIMVTCGTCSAAAKENEP